MPEQTYPPFATGALTSPRQLQRWLDNNRQGGPLKRTESYIELPIFSQAVTWLGYSDIIATWNFAADKNFVLKDIAELPTAGNYVLCVAYEEDGVVYRYKLCGPTGVFYASLTAYAGQLIKKNFRLEVWSVANATVSEATARKMWTSVRGSQDYRRGSDFELEDAGTVVTVFTAATRSYTSTALPNVFPTDTLAGDYRATLAADLGAGHITIGGEAITPFVISCAANGVKTTQQGNNAPQPVIYSTAATPNTFTGAFIVGAANVYLAFIPQEVGYIMRFDNGYTVSIALVSTDLHVFINAVDCGLVVAGKFYLIAMFDGTLGYLIDMNIPTTSTLTMISTDVSIDPTTLQFSNNNTNGMVECVIYSTVTNYQGVYNYFFNKYSGLWSIPLTFPSNSAVPSN